MDKTEVGSRIAMYGGSASTITIWGLQLSEVAAVISAAVALLGFCVHYWHTMQRNRREQEEHDATMARLTADQKKAS